MTEDELREMTYAVYDWLVFVHPEEISNWEPEVIMQCCKLIAEFTDKALRQERLR